MGTDKKIISVISKLNRLTQEGKIEWKRIHPPENLTLGTDEKIVDFFATSYKDRKIGLYEERYQAYDGDYDQSYWTSRWILAFFSGSWDLDWVFPHKPGIFELLESVRYKITGVDEIIDEFLDDDNDNED